jgi:hypothetical protein
MIKAVGIKQTVSLTEQTKRLKKGWITRHSLIEQVGGPK